MLQITILVSPIYRFISLLFNLRALPPQIGGKNPNIHMEFQRTQKSQIYLAKVCYCISIDIQTMEQTWNPETNAQAKNYRQKQTQIAMTLALLAAAAAAYDSLNMTSKA